MRAFLLSLAGMALGAALAHGQLVREYVYAGSVLDNEVRGFRVDPVTGVLVPVPGASMPVTEPSSLQGDVARRSLYISGQNGKLTRFGVTAATGALSPTPPIGGPGYPEGALALHPQLAVLYVTDALLEVVRAYDTSQACCLTHVGTAPVDNNAFGAAVHPSGRFLYATTSSDQVGGPDNSHVWGFAIDPATGLLTALEGSPWLEGSTTRTEKVVVEPGGRFLYAVNRIPDTIAGYAIDAGSGRLTRLAGAPFPAGISSPAFLAAAGQFLYVTGWGSSAVSGFRIGSDGTLTPIAGSPFASGGVGGLAVSGGNRFLYVSAWSQGAIWGYSIDPVTGALSPLPGQPFPAGHRPLGLTLVAFPSEGTAPTVSIDDAVAVTEGDSGATSAVFTIRLADPPSTHAAVDFATRAGTAGSPSDFASVSGTVTFPPGVVAQPVSVAVAGDVLDEPDEFFSVALSQPVGAVIGDAEAYARIRDDDGVTTALAALDRNADREADLRAQPGPVADVDLYLLERQPWSSYEVVVDGASGDLGDEGPQVDLVAPDLATVVPSLPVGTGSARTLRLENDQATPRIDYVRVRSAGCTTDCGADDTYRIRLRETTGRIARFNGSGGQVTVLVLQNRTDASLTAHVSYWGPDGTRVASVAVPLAAHAAVTVATPPPAQGLSGSITVSHDGSLGALAGKAVALEPASGLAFDTPLASVPR